MRKVCKNEGMEVCAYRLGEGSSKEEEMIAAGRIRRHEDGTYELFSQEALGETGEIALAGDYFKIDSEGCPYPNGAEWFLENHRKTGENRYVQRPRVLDAWKAGDPLAPEITFLLENEQLTLHEERPEQYFEAFLWGTKLNAGKDAVLLIRYTKRDEQGKIQEVSFDFISEKEFSQTYHYVEEGRGEL